MTIVDDARVSPLKFFTLVITSQPADVVGVIGGQAVFAVTYQTNNPSLVTLQWQIQTDGATWGDLVETAGFYEGVTTATLTVKALDNFLATRTSLNFRLRGLFSGSVPTYTRTAALTIPIHTDWTAGAGTPTFAKCGVNLVGSTAGFNAGLAPVVTGFSGPFTYQWTRVGGAAFTCLNPTAAVPNFGTTVLALGAVVSLWTCTITNGIDTVTTDTMALLGIGVSAAGTFYNNSGPLETVNGAPMSANAFVGPWATSLQRNFRRLTSPAATIDSPNAVTTGFTWTGTIQPGSAVSLLVNCPCFIGGGSPISISTTGDTVWGT